MNMSNNPGRTCFTCSGGMGRVREAANRHAQAGMFYVMKGGQGEGGGGTVFVFE